ncbi:acyl-phosphate glycerol 3-phosphate acyltransferase [Rhodomicrobium udaipurense JA643]|uniref:1-acyl-sn-glycerol-3-phosphate acyltransferase n=1 Tax=Rhodomicrobium udaipurense TaxID=1202716 RepID=A0A8I1GE22_9HYPH|nr:lysophospholipid acyltransferase family protein [Rhodomicrobium udaipurense]KAI95831.1 acyl-phosphate glycerol 3-phosphate acyltransferase [Rhodomicrobium udaipurense JA643]MBJ7543164.1 1-acyl-sn-glycerol-3-phosphate acyltransferase [Rhodomicrobium udaipurense]
MRAPAKALLYFRSALFIPILYISWAIFLILGSWLLLPFVPRSWAMAALKLHGDVSQWLLRVICGTKMEVRGREKLLPGPCIVAAKHQATWDTFAPLSLMRDPALVMKAELLSIPLYGRFCKKFELIPIQRELGPAALRQMMREARGRVAQGREIVIFPEGTRAAPGAAPNYKPGIIVLYQDLKVPVCPMALNSGMFWRRNSFLRYPGTIVVEFLDPIPPGLPKLEFMQRLESEIETASERLRLEARRELEARGLAQPAIAHPSFVDKESRAVRE